MCHCDVTIWGGTGLETGYRGSLPTGEGAEGHRAFYGPRGRRTSHTNGRDGALSSLPNDRTQMLLQKFDA